MDDEDKKIFALQDIDTKLKRNGSRLSNFTSMPQPPARGISEANVLIVDERSYDRADLAVKHDEWIKLMTPEQKKVYTQIMSSVLSNKGGVFFVYGFGGTGKTFLWKTLSAALRSK